MYKYTIFFIGMVLLAISCQKTVAPASQSLVLRGVDASFLPLLADSAGTSFKDSTGNIQSGLAIFRQYGVNTLRLRIWHHPELMYARLPYMQALAQEARNMGMQIWLCPHYSSTWADPSQQALPQQWQGLDIAALQDSVYQYTRYLLQQIPAEYIQIGNEINNGFLFPHGNYPSQQVQYLDLLGAGIQACRDHSPQTQIMLHYAGLSGADAFFAPLNPLDYDIMALSYYPLWHGKSLIQLKSTLRNLQDAYQRPTLLAEIAYPFTLSWNDWTDNIVGLPEHLLADYPATPSGQAAYLHAVRAIIEDTQSMGFCYWSPEWVAFNGTQATNGSPWENQALFDFNNQALPAWSVFGE